LLECYQRGRVTFKLAARKLQPEHFHAWRRHAKQLWYCLCILSPAWTAATLRQVDALELLGERLGREHDFHLLDEFLREHDFSKETERFSDLIARHRRRLRAAALKLGARVYSQEPATFCRHLQSEWNDWRGKAN
jgi:CHAD domain-containing protein